MDLSKLLSGCEGEKFYTLDRGELTLLRVGKYELAFIIEEEFYGKGKRCIYCYENDGRKYKEGECLVFPSKTQRDWSKFNKEEICTKFKLEKFHYNDEVLVRDSDKHIWKKRIFNQQRDYNGCRVAGVLHAEDYYQCIPYNDDNKSLYKTKKKPSEYYIWW